MRSTIVILYTPATLPAKGFAAAPLAEWLIVHPCIAGILRIVERGVADAEAAFHLLCHANVHSLRLLCRGATAAQGAECHCQAQQHKSEAGAGALLFFAQIGTGAPDTGKPGDTQEYDEAQKHHECMLCEQADRSTEISVLHP